MGLVKRGRLGGISETSPSVSDMYDSRFYLVQTFLQDCRNVSFTVKDLKCICKHRYDRGLQGRSLLFLATAIPLKGVNTTSL
jgi:hypothetical protein